MAQQHSGLVYIMSEALLAGVGHHEWALLAGVLLACGKSGEPREGVHLLRLHGCIPAWITLHAGQE